MNKRAKKIFSLLLIVGTITISSSCTSSLNSSRNYQNINEYEYVKEYLKDHFENEINDYKLTPSYQLNYFLSNNFDKKIKIKSKSDVKNIELNDFISNLVAEQNLYIDASDLPKEDKTIDWDNFSYQIDYAQIRPDHDDHKSLVVPVVFSYKAKNKKQRYKQINYFVKGFKSTETQNILEKTLDQEIKNLNLNNNNLSFKFLEDNLPNFTVVEFYKKFQKYGPYLKQFDKKFLMPIIFDGDQLQQNSKTTQGIVTNFYLYDVKFDFNDFQKLNLIYRFTAKKDSEIIAKNINLTLEGFAKIQTNYEKEFISNKLIDVDFNSHLSINHIDFKKIDLNNLKQFDIKSKNEKIKFNLEKIQKNSFAQNSLKLFFKTSSEIEEFNNISFSKNFGVPKHGYIFEPDLQDTTKDYILEFIELTQENLTQIDESIRERTDSKLLSGGFLDNRGIYSESGSQQIHLAEDVIVKENTPLFAPFKGKIIAGVYRPSQTFGTGIGTALFLEVDRKDLDIDEQILENELKGIEKFYFKFIHLDPQSLSLLGETYEIEGKNGNIFILKATSKKPIVVEKGQKIGLIGSKQVNGGWTPHVDITVYNGTKGFENNNESDDLIKTINNEILDENREKIKLSASIINEKRLKNHDVLVEQNKNTNIPTISVFLKAGQLKQVLKTDEITKKPLGKNQFFNSNSLNEELKKLPYVLIKDNNVYDRKNPVFNIEKKFNILDPNLFFQFNSKNSLKIELKDIFKKANK
ncbi:MSC_0775 family lipoprotein [Mycoplasmopsis cricetuli]|uniref:MSC_0775 family lipoprotein n=1 Tax=Mycoplasmopsis cricetuli TaxID=171283 RepID=UPI00046E5B94|nr:hypothetical protein [Mycoplasmopsis cricetuli]